MLTPHEGWIPANCQEINDEWHFLIHWRDTAGGWKAKHDGQAFFHPFKGPVVIINKQMELFGKEAK